MNPLLFLLLLLQAAAPKLPPFPTRTETSLYEQLGQCNADISDFRKWSAALAAEIQKRDTEIEKLKTELDPKKVKADEKKSEAKPEDK